MRASKIVRAAARAGGIVTLAGIGVVSATIAAAGITVGKRLRYHAHGKVVLITGGSRGLGLEIARQFRHAGADVVLVARNTAELTRAHRRLEQEPADGHVFTISADISTQEGAEVAVRQASRGAGRIDVLVNNAGIMTVAPFEDLDAAAFEEAMRVNFFSALYLTQAVSGEMRARGSGSIINICSIGGKIGVPHMLPYVASKFALVGFSEGLHAELAGAGIHVLTVCPGLMRTGSYVQAKFAGNREKEYRWFSLGAVAPGISTSAEAAARKIYRSWALKRAEITITPQAWLAARINGVAPAFSSRFAAVVNRLLLPSTAPKTQLLRGAELPQATLPFPKTWGKHLQARHNQN